MVAKSVVGGLVWPNIKLMQAFIVVRVTWKTDKDLSKTNALECSQHFFYSKSIDIFLQTFKCS